MGIRIGTSFIGSPSIQTSTANQEIIQPFKPSDWTIPKLLCYRLDFYNENDCTIKINEGEPIFLRAGQGFRSDMYDGLIWSFVVVKSGVRYNFTACY